METIRTKDYQNNAGALGIFAVEKKSDTCSYDKS